MALDAALLDLADGEGAAFFRLYRWEPHCLSFGRHEPARERYDRARIEALGLDTVRRPTGGRAVWHARELTYAVAAPLAVFGGLRTAYGAVHALLAAALQRLGAYPRVAPRAARVLGLEAGACFAAPVGGELLLANRKVVGSAQLRQGEAFLQHGSLLLEDDQALVAEVSRPRGARGAEAPLSLLLGRPVGFAEAAEAVAATAAEVLGGVTRSERAPEAVARAAARHADRFRSADWTWHR
jgi:lipoate-protein ligase A